METIQTSGNTLKVIQRVFVLECNREREAVAVCYLCGCIVAHCGGVIWQIAGRLEQDVKIEGLISLYPINSLHKK